MAALYYQVCDWRCVIDVHAVMFCTVLSHKCVTQGRPAGWPAMPPALV
jgi:hypothetical protein